MENKDMWLLDGNEHDEESVLYADNGVCEMHNRYSWKPEPIKDTLSHPYEEAEKKEANFQTRLKEKWKAFREWIGDYVEKFVFSFIAILVSIIALFRTL